MVAAVAVTGLGTADAAVVVVGVNGSASAGGTTTEVDGSIFSAGGTAISVPQRWTDPGVVGTTFSGIFGGTTTSTDWYVNGNLSYTTVLGSDNYMEIFYSLDSNVTGTNFRWAFNGNSPADSISPADAALIPTSAGSNSIVLDMNQIDDFAGGGVELTLIRWDPWNEESPPGPDQNRGTSFTIERVVFGTELVSAIPEPSSVALLAVAGVGIVARRRKRAA